MEETVSEKQPRPEAFIGSLLQFERDQNREALAHLRGYVRGTTGDHLRAAKYVAPFLGEKSFPSDRWFYTVGGLFAYHPMHAQNERRGPTLGAALGRLRGESGSMDQRFLTLVGTSADALAKPLFQAISLLKANSIGLNYSRLLKDLSYWGHDDNDVQKTWARDYFRSEKSEKTNSDTSESETINED
jgi:CRISPR type I-E-associated protein CasB/Cse2